MNWSWMMLGLQALLAAAGGRMMADRVLPGVHRFSQPGLVLDVWGPLILVLPMFAFIGGMDHSVGREGWIIIGGPLTLGILAVGMAMIRAARVSSAKDSAMLAGTLKFATEHGRVAACIAGVGALILLLGAAHDLTVWMGQVSFAIAAVLLWVNTPDQVSASESVDIQADGRTGGGLALAMVCALCQAAAIWSIGPEQRMIGMVLAVISGAFILAAAARLAGPIACLRLGGWALVLGVLFGLGTISLAHLVPNALRAIHDNQNSPTLRVAYGFGSLAAEGTAALLCGGLVLIGDRLSIRWRMATGIAILAFAAADMSRHFSVVMPDSRNVPTRIDHNAR